MKLFPESQEWVCTILINPTTNEINQKWIKVFNNYIEVLTRGRNLNSWTFDEFVNLLNGVLSFHPTETEEMRLFYNNIFKPQITQIGLPYINNWDLAGLFLIIRKMMEENLTTCENPINFITSNLHKLKPHMYSEDVDNHNCKYDFFIENFTCTQIEDDYFMSNFFYSNLISLDLDGVGITITDLLNSRNSHLLLNDSFRMLCYENIDSEQGFLLIPEALRNDINFIKKLLKNNGNALEFLGNEHKGNRKLVLISINEFSGSFCFATEELQSNREFIFACLERNYSVFRFLSTSFKSDRKIVLHAVKLNGSNLKYADSSLRNNIQVVLTAVKSHGMALEYVDESLKLNEKVILTAVRSQGFAIQYALFKNRKIILAAVKSIGWILCNHNLFEYISDESLLGDSNFILEAVKLNPHVLKYTDESLKTDKKFILKVVKLNGKALEYVDSFLKSDIEVVQVAVKNCGMSLEFASDFLKNNVTIALQSVKSNYRAFEVCSEYLRNNEEFIIEAYKLNPNIMKFIDPETIKKYKRLQELENDFKSIILKDEEFDDLPF